jgi:hypothetical protein
VHAGGDEAGGGAVHISPRRSYYRAKETKPMTRTARTSFILMLVIALAGSLAAQEVPKAATSTAETETTAAAGTDTSAETSAEETGTSSENTADRHFQVRDQFALLLEQHPDEFWMILKLDPALLTNDAFMSGYPEVQEFLVQHPEIYKNPRFYLSQFRSPTQERSLLDNLFELLAVGGGVLLTVFALAWLIRTLIEQRRWKQLSRTQSDVHNKILDRFNTTEQLLEYIRTPAGSKFLESAPIPLHVERPAGGRGSTLAARIMWSVQIGIVVAIVGLGMLLLSAVFEKDSSQGLFALGAIALCVGAGFIASAAVSLKLSRRLGLWEDGGAPPEALDGTGSVR